MKTDVKAAAFPHERNKARYSQDQIKLILAENPALSESVRYAYTLIENIVTASAIKAKPALKSYEVEHSLGSIREALYNIVGDALAAKNERSNPAPTDMDHNELAAEDDGPSL